MDNHTMFTKTIGLQRTAFNNTLTFFSTLQQHGEDLLKITLEKNPWLPKSSKNACLYWSDIYSKYLKDLRSVANQGFAEIERISSPEEKPMNKNLPTEITAKPVSIPRSVKKSVTVTEKTGNAKKALVAKNLPVKSSVEQDTPITKPIFKNASSEKPLSQNKENKLDEVQAATPEPKPTVFSQPDTTLNSVEKQPPNKPS